MRENRESYVRRGWWRSEGGEWLGRDRNPRNLRTTRQQMRYWDPTVGPGAEANLHFCFFCFSALNGWVPRVPARLERGASCRERMTWLTWMWWKRVLGCVSGWGDRWSSVISLYNYLPISLRHVSLSASPSF